MRSIDLARRVEAKPPEKRGGEVGGGDGVGVGVGAELVARAEGDPAPNSAAGQDHAVAVGPVVAPGAGVDLGRPAELAHGDDQGFLEQPAAAQVVDQGRERPVGRRDQVVLEPAEDVCVRVPVGLCPLYWPSYTVTNRTPASTSRRARSTLCPSLVRP